MVDENRTPAASLGFIHSLLLRHRKSLRPLGLFIIVATFLVKTEIRDYLKIKIDELTAAQNRVSDAVGQTYVLDDIAQLSQSMEVTKIKVDSLQKPYRADEDKTDSESNDLIGRLSGTALNQGTQILITSTFALVDAYPVKDPHNDEALKDFRKRATALDGDGDPLKAAALNEPVKRYFASVQTKADQWMTLLKKLYLVAEIASVVLYVIAGFLAFAEKLFHLKELDLGNPLPDGP